MVRMVESETKTVLSYYTIKWALSAQAGLHSCTPKSSSHFLLSNSAVDRKVGMIIHILQVLLL